MTLVWTAVGMRRRCFSKEVWGTPSYPDALRVSREGFIALATATSLRVMVPTLDPVEFEYCWAYLNQRKPPPLRDQVRMPCPNSPLAIFTTAGISGAPGRGLRQLD